LNTPKILVCPADTGRHAARNFTAGFDHSHISYFAGVDANERYPQRLLSGDSNLAVDGVPVKSGLVQLAPSASVSWTRERHGGAGNIGMADGSVQQTTTLGLTNALIQTGLATNRLAIP
jgi:prepilin-type processing-associated H-X9-DG protein